MNKIFISLIICFFGVTPYAFSQNIFYTYITPLKISGSNFSKFDSLNIKKYLQSNATMYFRVEFVEKMQQCSDKYILIDIEDETSAIKHRKNNRQEETQLALANDSYMIWNVVKTTKYYIINIKKKRFDNTIIKESMQKIGFVEIFNPDLVQAKIDRIVLSILPNFYRNKKEKGQYQILQDLTVFIGPTKLSNSYNAKKEKTVKYLGENNKGWIMVLLDNQRFWISPENFNNLYLRKL